MINEDKLRELAEKTCLQISNAELDFFKGSFSVVLPMINSLLAQKISVDVVAMERIISTPLEISELSKIYHCLNTNILDEEEIKKNSSLDNSKFIIKKKI